MFFVYVFAVFGACFLSDLLLLDGRGTGLLLGIGAAAVAEAQSAFLKLRIKMFGESPIASLKVVQLDQDKLMEKGHIDGCPPTIRVVMRQNHDFEVLTSSVDESCCWHVFPCVSFYVGRVSGKVKKVSINLLKIVKTGSKLRAGCGDTDWSKYVTSVVTAHLEVLKFSNKVISKHPSLVIRIFNHYHEEIFQELF